MIKNSVDVCKIFVHVLPLKSIFVAKHPHPTHFKMHILVVSTVGFEGLVNKKD